MIESPRAAQAWADYLAMGPERSLEGLLALYRTCTKPAQTKQLTTLKLWSRTFGWQERLHQFAEEEARKTAERESAALAELQALGIASRQNRVAAANERWRKMQQVIAERADDPEMETIPGGKTGLLVKTIKVVGTGPSAYEVGEYSVDVATLKEIREHEKQVAQDLGQWTEKQTTEVTGKDGSPLIPATEKKVLDADDLARLAAEVFSLGRVDPGDASTDGGGELVDTPQPDA